MAAQCRSRQKKQQKNQHTKQELLLQFQKRKHVRWDLVDVMETSKTKVITFKYGYKKWQATKDGLISSTRNDGQYSMHGCNLKPGDIIMWGEFNWFCTFGSRQIVCMEKYLKDSIQVASPFHYERKRNIRSNQQSSSDGTDNQIQIMTPPMETHETGSQFCSTQQNLEEPENKEYDENVVEFIPETVKHFVNRELDDIGRLEWAHLNLPLLIGDVMRGPSGGAINEDDAWIVSKSMVLRRTYCNKVNRKDIQLQCGQIFEIGEKLHYATRYRSMFICVSSYRSQYQIVSDFKARNKNKNKPESTGLTRSKDV